MTLLLYNLITLVAAMKSITLLTNTHKGTNIVIIDFPYDKEIKSHLKLLPEIKWSQTLKSFYKSVRPWGWWQPVYQELIEEDESIKKNSDFWNDMLNCAIGIVWQSSMIVLPIYFVIRDYPKTIIALTVFIITSIILKFTWLDKIRKIKNQPAIELVVSQSESPI